MASAWCCVIVFDDEAIDRGLQVDDRDEDTALQCFNRRLVSFAKKFDGVEPRTHVGVKSNVKR